MQLLLFRKKTTLTLTETLSGSYPMREEIDFCNVRRLDSSHCAVTLPMYLCQDMNKTLKYL